MKVIFADTNKYDDKFRLILTSGSFRDLEKYQIGLREGMDLWFYMDDADDDGNQDDLIMKGILQYDSENERWTAKIDWTASKQMSKFTESERKELGIY